MRVTGKARGGLSVLAVLAVLALSGPIRAQDATAAPGAATSADGTSVDGTGIDGTGTVDPAAGGDNSEGSVPGDEGTVWAGGTPDFCESCGGTVIDDSGAGLGDGNVTDPGVDPVPGGLSDPSYDPAVDAAGTTVDPGAPIDGAAPDCADCQGSGIFTLGGGALAGVSAIDPRFRTDHDTTSAAVSRQSGHDAGGQCRDGIGRAIVAGCN